MYSAGDIFEVKTGERIPFELVPPEYELELLASLEGKQEYQVICLA